MWSRNGNSLSLQPIDEAYFDASRRIVGWSSTPPTLSVMSTSGATLVDRTMPSVRCIARVAVNAAHVVAFLGIPSSAAPNDTRLSIFFVVGCSIVHLSAQPFPWLHFKGNNADRRATTPMLKCMRVGSLDCCMVSARGAQHIALYCRQRPNHAEALALEDELLLLEDGPFPGSAVCVLKNGKVIVISCEETETSLKLESVTEIETGMLDIRQVRFAGRLLMWVLSGDGRLIAFRAVAPSNAHDEERRAGAPSLSISRNCLFTLERAAFSQDGQGGTTKCEGFTVHGSAQIWADERSLSLSLIATSDDRDGVEVTRVAVDPDFSSNVTAVLMHLDAKDVVALSVQNSTLVVLAKHPRKERVIERVTLDVDSAIAANASTTSVHEAKSMCCKVTWADHQQLGLLRSRCEALVDQLDRQSIALGTLAESRERIECLIGLQRTALAFLKREHTDTQCALLGPENSVSHALLRRLRNTYLRLASHQFLLNVGITAEKAAQPLADALDLPNLRDAAAAHMREIKQSFHETFGLQSTLEHPRDTLERWGAGMQPVALAIDVLARETGFDVSRVSLEQLIAQFPSTTSTLNATTLAVVLMYVASGSTRPRSEVTLYIEELARILDVPVGLLSWATLMYVADTEARSAHVVGEQDADAGATTRQFAASEALDHHGGHCLESCMPFVAKLLPSILDGLMCRGQFETALQVGRFALSVYPTGGIPNGFGSKVLMLAYRGGDAALVAQIAQSAMGTALSKLAVRTVALIAETLNSLSVADGLYPVHSEEFHELESIIEGQARQEMSGSLVNASLLCELRLIAARYDATARYTSTFGVMPMHAQRFHAFREQLRSHLPDAPEDVQADSEQYRRATRSASSPPVSAPSRVTTCLREPDEELNNAVRSTSSSNIVQRRAASARRPTTSTAATGRSTTYHPGGASMGLHGAHIADDPLICGGAVPHGGGSHCMLPRPCPYHDAGFRSGQ